MIITAPFGNKLYFFNPYATKVRNLADELTFHWEGRMTISPSYDNWVDAESLPAKNVDIGPSREFWNELGNMLPFQAEFGSWNTIARSTNGTQWNILDQPISATSNNISSFGTVHTQNGARTTVGTTSSNSFAPVSNFSPSTGTIRQAVIDERTITQTSLSSETEVNSLGDRIVNVGLVPFIRQQIIEVDVLELKGNTRFYVFFDGVNVTQYCEQIVDAYDLPTIPPPNGNVIPGVTTVIYPETPLSQQIINSASVTFGDSGVLISNEYGQLRFKLMLPGGTFNVGQRILKVTDDDKNREDFAKSSAFAEFTANGLSYQKEESVISTETPKIVKTRSTERRTQIAVQRPPPVNNDPTSYSFFVEQNGGAFLTKIDLFFRKKSQNLGVTVQIRNMVNGYPGPVVVPFSEVKLYPALINISEDASAKTEVIFQNPVYLSDDTQYCICLLPERSNTEFELWVSELGKFDIYSNTRVTELPGAGMVFTSANNSTWSAHQSEDFKCNIYFAHFNTSSEGSVNFYNEDKDHFEVSGYSNGLPQFSETILGCKVLKLNMSNTSFVVGTTKFDVIGTGAMVPKNFDIIGKIGNNEIIVDIGININVNDAILVIGDTENVWFVTEKRQAIGTVEHSKFGYLTLNKSNGLFIENSNAIGQKSFTSFAIDKILDFNVNIFQPRLSEIIFPNTEVRWYATLFRNGSNIEQEVTPNRDFDFDQEYKCLSKSNERIYNNSQKSLKLNAKFKTYNANVSPIIDTEKVAALAIQYQINHFDDFDEFIEQEKNEYNESILTRYFSKPVNLSLMAEDIMIYLDASIPSGGAVHVFYKIQHPDDMRDFHNDLKWKYINGIVGNGEVFSEYFFTPPMEADHRITDPLSDMYKVIQYDEGNYKGYTRFAIKIVLTSTNTSKVPLVRNLRAISLLV
jgi:hypothetical protein